MMADPIEEFFDRLGGRGHEPLLEKVSGTCRFDVQNGGRTDHWLVRMDRGDIEVSRADGDADCVVRGDRPLLEGITRGEVNAMAAVLRGALLADGDLELLILLQRLLPAPVPARAGAGGGDA